MRAFRLATTIDHSGFVSKFRGPRCMATYLAVDAQRGETDYRAFVRRADADAFATGTHAAAITWDNVVAQARYGRRQSTVDSRQSTVESTVNC